MEKITIEKKGDTCAYIITLYCINISLSLQKQLNPTTRSKKKEKYKKEKKILL